MNQYNVQKKYKKFLLSFETNIQYLNEGNFSLDPKKQFQFHCSLVNTIWQSWNSFWRTYWLAEVIGGFNLYNNKIVSPYNSSLTEEQAIYLLLTGGLGGTKKHSDEKSWGDVAILTSVARKMFQLDGKLVPTLPISIKAERISAAISILGNAIQHMQLIRNCSIHIDEYNAKRVKSISAFYTLSSYKYPTDFVFATTLLDGKIAIKSWQDEMLAFLSFLY